MQKMTKEEEEYLPIIYKKFKEKRADSDDLKPERIKALVESRMSERKRNVLRKKGQALIDDGKVAVVTLAGGQGTRLGHDGPKGTFVVDPNTGKSLFEIQCDRMKKISGGKLPWYIMTSHLNDSETKRFFEEKDYFGCDKNNITFFVQNRIAVMDIEGQPVYEADGSIMRAPNGNGGCINSMESTGVLRDMKKRGVEYVFICGIDNCLARPAEPLFVGFAEEEGAEIAAKSVMKKYASEKVGIFCKKNGCPAVMEYTEIPDEYREKTEKNGDFTYGEANILSYILKMEYIERMIGERPDYHPAVKKMQYWAKDAEGELVPKEGECLKSELFLFDLFAKADDMKVLRVEREEEFAPVKNKTGQDSPETALELLKRTY